MKIYNSLSNEIEDFIPLSDKEVSLYSCGPTVYHYAHIGNMSTYIMVDIIKRSLLYLGYNVNHTMNITDVGHLTNDDSDTGDDKIELAAKKENKTPKEIADYYTDIFKKDLVRLNVLPPSRFTNATDYVQGMIDHIVELEKKDIAYKTSDGVYFDITKFEDYGKLSGNNISDLDDGARIDVNDEKRNPQDFALWKSVSEDTIQKWESPWGIGCPGWHIECSVMARETLGDQIDIHTGGEDNKFPHHECEIAQSESLTGKKFCNYWVHKSFINLGDEKMSKSKGSILLVQDIVDKGFDPLAFRFMILSASYRSPQNFSFEILESTQKGIDRINNTISRLQSLSSQTSDSSDWSEKITSYELQAENAIKNDFNTAELIATTFNFIGDCNKSMDANTLSTSDSQKALELLRKIDTITACMNFTKKEEEYPQEIIDLINQREEARKNKDYQRADEIRDILTDKGINLIDNQL